MENEEASTSVKKLKSLVDAGIEIDASFGYRILNFLSVFSVISDVVKCKKCNSNVIFTEVSNSGLGFKLKISYLHCDPVYAYSSPLIDNKDYDINRRIVLAFRILGIGLSGIEKFCGIMDLPKPIFNSFYDTIVSNVHIAAQKICQLSMKNAVDNEKQESDENDGLTVSGGATWRKGDSSSSLFYVSTVTGYCTKKILDLLIKSSYCKVCEFWSKFEGTEEYEEWKESHESKDHEGSTQKMEVDAICELFARSEDLYGVKYATYIGDGDSKTYKDVVDSKPYKNFAIEKKECIGHLQKRMATQLRKVKKENKNYALREKLTAKLIDELTLFYGLAIRRNTDSIVKMKNAIWATFFHKISTNCKPQHQLCPTGENSWCSWQKAKASGTLKNYNHKTTIPKVIQKDIKLVYKKFSELDLLERCLGGFTQINNESYLNSVIWSLAPKVTSSSVKIFEIASYIATSVFNDGYRSVLLMMELLNLKIGPNAQRMCEEVDTLGISIANKLRAQEATKEARKLKRAKQKKTEDIRAILEEL